VFRDEGPAASLSMVSGDEVVGLSLVERLEQKDHILTPDEERLAAGEIRSTK
jgi:hypothetical protein